AKQERITGGDEGHHLTFCRRQVYEMVSAINGSDTDSLRDVPKRRQVSQFTSYTKAFVDRTLRADAKHLGGGIAPLPADAPENISVSASLRECRMHEGANCDQKEKTPGNCFHRLSSLKLFGLSERSCGNAKRYSMHSGWMFAELFMN